MQVDASEPPEAVLPEVDAGDVSRDDILAELSETNTVATEDNKVTLLEENTVATQAPVPITSAPDAESKSQSKTKTCINLTPLSLSSNEHF